MRTVRRGPITPYIIDCTRCQSAIEYDAFDIVLLKISDSDYTQTSYVYYNGIRCPECGSDIWNEQTKKMQPFIKEA